MKLEPSEDQTQMLIGQKHGNKKASCVDSAYYLLFIGFPLLKHPFSVDDFYF